MQRWHKYFSRFVLFLSLCFLLLACSKITQTNFEKIKNNMTIEEVTAILGQPTNTESMTIAGISGTSAVWRDNNAEIDIQLLNNRVVVKAFSKISPQEANDASTTEALNTPPKQKN